MKGRIELRWVSWKYDVCEGGEGSGERVGMSVPDIG